MGLHMQTCLAKCSSLPSLSHSKLKPAGSGLIQAQAGPIPMQVKLENTQARVGLLLDTPRLILGVEDKYAFTIKMQNEAMRPPNYSVCRAVKDSDMPWLPIASRILPETLRNEIPTRRFKG
ncbi:hypothetical protein AMTR_s00086p00068340 [Amborella trichopoda]|uniref:Uncharacterized protein n=1 Tax=Amborella trichopoda TaxID=13333 RepID=W1P4D9_AMBTC|nr:hypothetical protein AMTR_s00086p00068340 [Amborella trichopoda]